MQAPISFELIPMSDRDLGAEDGRQTVRILMRNKHYFAGTAGLQLHFRLLLDGLPLRMGDLLQQDPEAWLPGGSTQIAPQVCTPHPFPLFSILPHKYLPLCRPNPFFLPTGMSALHPTHRRPPAAWLHVGSTHIAP